MHFFKPAYFDSAAQTVTGGAGITYATLDPANKGSNIVLSGGNLVATAAVSGTWNNVVSTIGKTSGKWYWEYTLTSMVGGTNASILGIGTGASSRSTFLGGAANTNGIQGGTLFSDLVDASSIQANYSGAVTMAQSDVWGFAFNADTGNIWMSRNGTWQNHDITGQSIWSLKNWPTGTAWFPGVSCILTTNITTVNFGASAFSYSVPAGYNSGVY